ncbi:MAG: toll/interleukin-1 receptor domain-containing protein, partial [Sphingomicrobium sp.]
MADVFISYSRTDETTASKVAETLGAAGYQVWRDDQLPAHRAYSEVIEERLKGAKAVVVLWSAEAAKSQWVRAEADSARTAGTLIQASLDGSVPPLPFNQIQCADLKDWDGDAGAAGWRKLADSVAALAPSAADRAARPKRDPARALSICVLPFQNMSGD